jgi:hypothetical protein
VEGVVNLWGVSFFGEIPPCDLWHWDAFLVIGFHLVIINVVRDFDRGLDFRNVSLAIVFTIVIALASYRNLFGVSYCRFPPQNQGSRRQGIRPQEHLSRYRSRYFHRLRRLFGGKCCDRVPASIWSKWAAVGCPRWSPGWDVRLSIEWLNRVIDIERDREFGL